jgi:hypothetical protein
MKQLQKIKRNLLREFLMKMRQNFNGFLLIRPHQLISMRVENVPKKNHPQKSEKGKIHKKPFCNGFTHHKTENLPSAYAKRQKCFTTSRIINFLDGISLAGIQHVILLTIFGLWNPSK